MIVLVGLSNAAGFVYGLYRIAVRTIQDHELHQALHHGGSGWLKSPSFSIELTLGLIWLCSIALIIPASSIGASELFGGGRGRRISAAAFVAWLYIGVVCQYAASSLAAESRGSLFAPDAWLHDGRSWWALMCLVSIVMFAGALKLLKPGGVRPSVSAA